MAALGFCKRSGESLKADASATESGEVGIGACVCADDSGPKSAVGFWYDSYRKVSLGAFRNDRSPYRVIVDLEPLGAL